MARTRDPERYADQRRSILKAAERCFAESGFHAASTADICAAAGGMSPGRLYHYFPSKQAIIEALVIEERAAATARLAGVGEADDPAGAIADVAAEAVRTVSAGSYGRLALEILAEAARNTAVADLVRRSEAQVHQSLVQAIRLGQARERIDPSQDPEQIARLILLLVDGATGRELIEAAPASADLAALVRAVVIGLLRPKSSDGAPGAAS